MILWILTGLSAVQLASPTDQVISVEQPPLIVAENKTATVSCNYTCKSSKTITFKALMFKGTARAEEVCTISWNNNNNETSYTSNGNGSKIRCHTEVKGTSVTFHLYNLSVAQTDLYICKIEALYPAPYHHGESNGTVIHVKEEPQRQEEPKYSQMMTAGIVIIGCYSMAVTGALIYYQVRNKKKRLPQNMISWVANGPKKRNSQPSAPARTYTTYRFWEP